MGILGVWGPLRVFLELVLSIEKIHFEDIRKSCLLGKRENQKKKIHLFFQNLLGVCLLVSEEESQLILGGGSFGKENR